MIAQLIGGAPQVARFEKKIAVFDVVDGDNHGFLFKPDVAVAVATRILAAVADLAGRDHYTHPVEGMEITGGGVDARGERRAQLVLTVGGAPLAVDLTATQVAELAAGFAAAASALDRPGRPREDR